VVPRGGGRGERRVICLFVFCLFVCFSLNTLNNNVLKKKIRSVPKSSTVSVLTKDASANWYNLGEKKDKSF